MYLTAETVFPYLLQRGILSPRDIVQKEWFVLQNDRSRPVLRVSRLTGEGWIIKQASPLDLTHVRLLDREAALYNLAERDGWALPLRRFLPRLRAYDPGVHTLIVEQLPYDTVWDQLRRPSAQYKVLAHLLADAFATIHRKLPSAGVPTALHAPQLPWILQLENTDANGVEQPSMRAVLDLVRREPALGQALENLATVWRVETLIHGDGKLDNMIVRTGGEPRVWLIDWAFASEGDPAWDIGSMIRSVLLLWIFGIAFRREEPFLEAAQRSVFPLTLVSSFTRNFVVRYLSARGIEGRAARDFVRRSLRYAGAAMVQSALADARSRGRFTVRQIAMLQMSSDLIENPDRSRTELLGEK